MHTNDDLTVPEVSRTFAFVDLAGYTALTEQHGDVGAADCAERFYALAERSLIGETRIVKRIGDAVMLVSPTPAECLSTVLGLVRAANAEPLFPACVQGSTLALPSNAGVISSAEPSTSLRASAHTRGRARSCVVNS